MKISTAITVVVGARHAVPASDASPTFVVAQHAARLSATLTTGCPSTLNALFGLLL
jgi:hypothetical protein